jgi:hypothetical protein
MSEEHTEILPGALGKREPMAQRRRPGDLTATWKGRTPSRVRRDGSIDHAHAFQREAVAQVVDQLSLEWLGEQHSCVAEEERGLLRELLGQRPGARE